MLDCGAIFCGVVPIHPGLCIPEVEGRFLSLRDFLAIVPQHCYVVSQVVLFRDHSLAAVAERKLFRQFVDNCLRGAHGFVILKKNMPCGCKKGAGMYVRGGQMPPIYKKKRRRKKGSGWVSRLGQAGRNRRAAFRNLARASFVGTKVGSGHPRARFLSGVTWHKGSGMGFSGAGMSWTGSGLRGKRMIYRQGSGRRMV